jgi:uncharacterized membrane protein
LYLCYWTTVPLETFGTLPLVLLLVAVHPAIGVPTAAILVVVVVVVVVVVLVVLVVGQRTFQRKMFQ